MLLERFEEFDQRMNSLSAHFVQSVRWEESGLTQSVEGTVEYRKPGLLRLEHHLPERQTLVADGLWLWIWRKETNQVIQTRIEEWKKSQPMAQALLDFGRYGNLLKRYEVAIASVSAPSRDGYRTIELHLTPKERQGDFLLRLRLSTRDFFPAKTELKVGGVLVHSILSEIHYNPTLGEERFRFLPPPGADVFQNLKPQPKQATP
jgi:outer membrane lipoprotein carrier protein